MTIKPGERIPSTTLEHMSADGRWRWFGMQFLVPGG